MSSSEVFGHIKDAHQALSKPASHFRKTDVIGWMYDAENFRTELNGKAERGLNKEMEDTLTILTEEQRYLLSVDNTLAAMCGDIVALDYNQRFARTSIAIKGQGRKDTLTLMGTISQKISIPTSLQKVRRILTGKRGEVTSAETEEGYSLGNGGE